MIFNVKAVSGIVFNQNISDLIWKLLRISLNLLRTNRPIWYVNIIENKLEFQSIIHYSTVQLLLFALKFTVSGFSFFLLFFNFLKKLKINHKTMSATTSSLEAVADSITAKLVLLLLPVPNAPMHFLNSFVLNISLIYTKNCWFICIMC